MKKLLLIAATLAVTGCASSPYPNTVSNEWLKLPNPNTYGYKDYDPCIRCGEGWVFLNIDETQALKEKTYAR